MKFNIKLGNIEYAGALSKDHKERESFKCSDINLGVEFDPSEYVECYKLAKDLVNDIGLADLAKIAINHMVSEEAKDNEVSREERKFKLFGSKKSKKVEEDSEIEE